MSLARIGRLVLATGAVTAVVAGIGTQAHAHGWANWVAEQGADYAGVSSNKRYIGACDMERDGNGVYALYKIRGSTNTWKVGEGNGSEAGCGTRTTSSDITEFVVCEDDTGSDSCSPPVPVP